MNFLYYSCGFYLCNYMYYMCLFYVINGIYSLASAMTNNTFSPL